MMSREETDEGLPLPSRVDANATRLLSPADRLALVVVACQLAIALLGGVREWPLVAGLLVIAMLVFVLARWATRSRVGDLAHAFVTPYAAVALLFETSGGVAEVVNHTRWDATFSAIDERFFATLLALWRGALGRPDWLTAIMSVVYVSFYFFPAIVGGAIFARRPRREFDDFAFTIEAAFFLPYVGYMLTPTLGPRDAVSFGSSGVASMMRAFVEHVELNTLDAFPSGHVMVALVVAFLAPSLGGRRRSR